MHTATKERIAWCITKAEKAALEGDPRQAFRQLRRAIESFRHDQVSQVAMSEVLISELRGAPDSVVEGVMRAYQAASMAARLPDGVQSPNVSHMRVQINAVREALFWTMARNMPPDEWAERSGWDGWPGELSEDLPDDNEACVRSGRKIFLCHAKEDAWRVRQIYERLKRRGHSPWMDVHSLLPGSKWREEIRRAIRESHCFVACLSVRSVAKRGFVQQEIRFAIDELDNMPQDEIFVIPVRLDDCEVPESFSELHWLDIQEPQAYERLFAAIETV